MCSKRFIVKNVHPNHVNIPPAPPIHVLLQNQVNNLTSQLTTAQQQLTTAQTQITILLAQQTNQSIRTDNSSDNPSHAATTSNNKRRRQLSGEHGRTSYGKRRGLSTAANIVSSKCRKSSPRPYRSTRDRESLSPGPSPQPTSQQSTQRGSVYTHEGPSSKHQSIRDHHRTKSDSRERSHVNDERTASLSETEQQSQSESIFSSSPTTTALNQQCTTLSSIIKPVMEENPSDNNIISSETNSINQTNDLSKENTSNNGRKHHYHHGEHHRDRSRSPNSKSKYHHCSKDNDSKTITHSFFSLM